jgi:peptidase S41-like protein
MLSRSSSMILASLLACGSLGSLAASQAPSMTKAQWREDLKYFARELPKRHKNLFHSMSREQFGQAVADLDARIPSLPDHAIIVGIFQITARVGDGHTGGHIPDYFKRYPLALFWFGQDLRVLAAGQDYQRALGARVVKIGSVGIDEVQARVITCFPSAENENEWYVLGTSPAFIVMSEFLNALGIVPDLGTAPFTFEDEQGKPFTLDIRPVETQIVNGVPRMSLVPLVKEPPLYHQKPGEPFWFTTLPDSDTVYVNFRSYPSLGKNAGKLFDWLDAHPAKRLVIDMRQNGGGDFLVGRKHLIQPITQRPAINQKGRLYVIVGRHTFSAALANAVDFRKQTNAILVGEPIGERPNSYSENDEMTLPNSHLIVSYSTRYYQFADEDVPAVVPDHRIDPDWEAFRAGRDPVMEWILAQKN